LKERDVRDEFVLATKYTSSYAGPGKIQSNYGGNGTKSMKASVELSLKRLQTSYIDLLWVHWWDFTTSIPELMLGLNDLIRLGKVHYIGISDAPAWVVSKANQYARDHGLRQFCVYQGMFNCGMRDFERDIIPMCHDEGMGICPYGTLGQGRFQPESVFKEREKHNPGRKFTKASSAERDKTISHTLEKLGNAKGTSVTSIALAYALQKTPYLFPIVGGRKVSHIQGNIDALSVTLTPEEIDEIESVYEFDHGFPHTFLSGSLFDGEKPRGADKPEDVWLTKTMLGTFDWVKPPQAIRPPSSS
jgi:aryl-alcohol dehydrogenase-like predicted oxidoreductase